MRDSGLTEVLADYGKSKREQKEGPTIAQKTKTKPPIFVGLEPELTDRDVARLYPAENIKSIHPVNKGSPRPLNKRTFPFHPRTSGTYQWPC